ncbi:hypothetical protein AB434_1879 [Heyndrickxia coagulans]|uniref:Uncharacterized protein n=1 Tax=Heyndrickxia coagulans TaxID=1398 RepID=A0A0C5CBN3_HEYCO|nr:hypothetical protein SB48_HM08orf05519 [Heyndrickxia coagulans]AKN54284.1 hypothetical protein AB434_1879 [Heyndrickxia coagulans]KWZ78774.1 hypothetical protein HMPREF3213_02873 [Heyndrickxia coagulans]KYC89373.1 hypothetical protein B4096_0702 [Heyndrickxia coagulans]
MFPAVVLRYYPVIESPKSYESAQYKSLFCLKNLSKRNRL